MVKTNKKDNMINVDLFSKEYAMYLMWEDIKGLLKWLWDCIPL